MLYFGQSEILWYCLTFLYPLLDFVFALNFHNNSFGPGEMIATFVTPYIVLTAIIYGIFFAYIRLRRNIPRRKIILATIAGMLIAWPIVSRVDFGAIQRKFTAFASNRPMPWTSTAAIGQATGQAQIVHDTGLVVYTDQNTYLLLEPIRITVDLHNVHATPLATTHLVYSHPFLLVYQASTDGVNFSDIGRNTDRGVAICGNSTYDETAQWLLSPGYGIREQKWVPNEYAPGAVYLRALFMLAGQDTTFVSDSLTIAIVPPTTAADSEAYSFLTSNAVVPMDAERTVADAVVQQLIYTSGSHNWTAALAYFDKRFPSSRYALHARNVMARCAKEYSNPVSDSTGLFGWRALPPIAAQPVE